MTSFDLIVIFGLCQGFILAFFILSSKHYRSIPNYWLSSSLILLTVSSILDIIGNYYETKTLLQEFFINDLPYEFLIYVPLYYYFKSSIAEDTKRVQLNYYLLLPFLIDTLINVGIALSIDKEEVYRYEFLEIFYNVESILSTIFNLFLCYKAYRFIKSFTRIPDSQNWLLKIWRSSLILIIVGAISLSIYTWNESLSIFIMFFYVMISLWLFWIIYNGVVNLNLINDRRLIRAKISRYKGSSDQKLRKDQDSFSKTITNKGKSEKKGVKTDKLAKHFDELNTLMKEQQLYRNEDLSLQDVADEFDFSEGYVSQIIRKTTEKNFTTWVNEFRVSAAQNMLSDAEFHNYTILAIGLEAGFKSKSAFYASFKQITGLTPSQYRKKMS